jgi:hypothetical protein
MPLTMPIRLSKSKLLAFRQCERRLWLELHHPELRHDDDASMAAFAVGHQVGDLARSLYDPDGNGVLVDPQAEGLDAALARSEALLATAQPVFEAGFAGAGALAFADILLPSEKEGQRRWRMVEVKSSTSVKAYYLDDAAIQAYVAQAAGLPLDAIAIAHIDKSWVYPGGGDYRGLLAEHDLTDSAFARGPEVKAWIARAQDVAMLAHEPEVRPGGHCKSPYACGFAVHCRGGKEQTAYPVEWLPKQGSRAVRERIEEGAADMREVEDALLNAKQQRVKQHTLSNETYFDAAGAAADLAPYGLPAWFIDFETISFTVPIWKGTSPYQKIPFQFSVHRLEASGELAHTAFLNLTGEDPSLAFAEALVGACGTDGPVFVYNAAFETGRIAELAARFPHVSLELLAINGRVVDLLPIARERYYHPGQQGSWSIKRVLPAVAPDLRYDALEGVQDGGAAMQAYVEALDQRTSPARKQQIERQLLDYCHLDTLAMVRLWQVFSGQQSLPAPQPFLTSTGNTECPT